MASRGPGPNTARASGPRSWSTPVARLDLDHKLAIGIAGRLGIREYIRAFLPQNLQWLCRECHKLKTASDRRAMAALDRPEVILDRARRERERLAALGQDDLFSL